jgi:amino acid transporter
LSNLQIMYNQFCTEFKLVTVSPHHLYISNQLCGFFVFWNCLLNRLILLILGCLSYLELGTMIPESGGEYTYILKAFGSVIGYLYCWMGCLVLKPATFAILGKTCATYAVQPYFTNATVEEYESIEDAENARWWAELLVTVVVLGEVCKRF